MLRDVSGEIRINKSAVLHILPAVRLSMIPKNGRVPSLGFYQITFIGHPTFPTSGPQIINRELIGRLLFFKCHGPAYSKNIMMYFVLFCFVL